MAATATQKLQVIRRESNSFENDEKQTVAYHDALCIDADGNLTLVRSSRREDIEPYVPGTVVDAEVEFRKMGTVPVTQVRPSGAPSNVERW